MSFIRNPEVKGILVLFLIILTLATALAGMTGKLEQWFGISWFSGPRSLDKIVFVSERKGVYEIYSINPDRTSRLQLTENASVTSAPAISPQGNRIIFVGMHGNAQQVLRISGNGGTPEQLTTATGPKAMPSFSPDGKSMAFIASGKVYVSDLEGGNLDPILPPHEDTHAAMVNRDQLPAYSNYAWTPNSAGMIGVTKAGEDDVLVYLSKLEGKPMRMAFAKGVPVKVNGIAWAAQKPMLAVSVKVDKTNKLAIFDAESKQLQLLMSQKEVDFGQPALSPDGSALVVPIKSAKGDQAGLLKIDIQLQNTGLLAKGEFENPRFSPDGDRILATQLDGEKRDVVLIDASNGDLTRLTTDGKSFNAIWTPVSEE